jgi:carbonic anhydrase
MAHHIPLRVILVVVCAGPALALASGTHWAYGKGHGGPAEWGELLPEYSACGVGTHQSPIDIAGAEKADLPRIIFGYHRGSPDVVNNGHTIQVKMPPGNTIRIGDHVYEFVQFHFHTPSEEAISGKRAPLVAHLVHEDEDGNLAVVAVLFDVGAENAALKAVFAHMPREEGEDEVVQNGQVSLAAVLPMDRSYYEFEGSLTTPPCTEGVRWIVLQHRGTISQAQLAAFKKLYPANARPLQPLNGRTVHASR